MRSALYVYDFSRLSTENIEVHRLGSALVGVNNFIDYDAETLTISYIKDFNQLRMIPLPHRNTFKFFGMGQKSEYLLWRQNKGTFTAIDKKLKMTMWSTATGKILQTSESKLDRISINASALGVSIVANEE